MSPPKAPLSLSSTREAEQTANLYAGKLHAKGFTIVCFDASHQGESGGESHFHEDPAARVSDV